MIKLEFCIDDFAGILRMSRGSPEYHQEIKDLLRVGQLKNGRLVYYTDSTIIDERIRKFACNPDELEKPNKWDLGQGEFIRIATADDCELLRSRWVLINITNDYWYVRLMDWFFGRNKKMEFLSADTN